MRQNILRLKSLWERVFGDSINGFRELFFNTWYDPELTVSIKKSGEIVSMGFLLPVGEFVEGSKAEKCAMIYGVATDTAYRGKGHGTVVSNELLKIAKGKGYTITVLKPATNELFNFYEKKTHLVKGFSTEQSVGATDLSLVYRASLTGAYREAAPSDYISAREDICASLGLAHIRYTEKLLRFYTESGGALFIAENPKKEIIGVAAVELNGGVALINELIIKEGINPLLAANAAASKLDATAFRARYPGEGAAFAMATRETGNAWYGLTFE